jgi:hypothetical protein
MAISFVALPRSAVVRTYLDAAQANELRRAGLEVLGRGDPQRGSDKWTLITTSLDAPVDPARVLPYLAALTIWAPRGCYKDRGGAEFLILTEGGEVFPAHCFRGQHETLEDAFTHGSRGQIVALSPAGGWGVFPSHTPPHSMLPDGRTVFWPPELPHFEITRHASDLLAMLDDIVPEHPGFPYYE